MTPGIEAWCPACESWSADIYRCSNPQCGINLADRDPRTRRTYHIVVDRQFQPSQEQSA